MLTIRLGAVRFSQAGRPVVRVAKELSDNVKLVRDNFTANLISYAGEVMTEHSDEYKTQVALAVKAGEPIAQHDRVELSKALEAKAEAERSQHGNRNREGISASLKE